MSAVLDFPVKPETRDLSRRLRARDTRRAGLAGSRDRQRALTRFAELGFPSRRSESWRYLDLQPLRARAAAAGRRAGRRDSPRWQRSWRNCAGRRRCRGWSWSMDILPPELSRVDMPEGVWFGSMAAGDRRAAGSGPRRDRPATLGCGASVRCAECGVFRRRLRARHRARASSLDAADRDHSSRLRRHRGVVAHPQPGHRSARAAAPPSSKPMPARAAIGATMSSPCGSAAGAELHPRRAGRGSGGGGASGAARCDARPPRRALPALRCCSAAGTVRHEASVTIAGEGAQCELDGAFVVARQRRSQHRHDCRPRGAAAARPAN